MIKPVHYLIISSGMLLIGMLFYGIYNDLILIRLPFAHLSAPFIPRQIEKQSILPTGMEPNGSLKKKRYSFHRGLRTLQDLVTSWLSLLEEDRRMPEKISLQSAMIDQAGTEAFISFDRNPLAKEQSTFDKLLWIEGLLRTIRTSGLPLQTIRFLVNAKPLTDIHLDFSHSWPVTGYSNLHLLQILTKN